MEGHDFEEALDHVISGMFTFICILWIKVLTAKTIASKIQTKKKNSVSQAHLETIKSHAQRHGLTTTTLIRLLEVLTSANAFDQTTQQALIKILYPIDRIPSNLICIVVNGLGYGSRKASVPSQRLLLEWMIMIHDALEDPSILCKFYSVFFNLLDMSGLRAHLCPLLVRITRSNHVRPFRIQMLQDLNKKIGREPHFSKLMQIYDAYAPGILDIRKTGGRVPDLSQPDPEWASQLQMIRDGADHVVEYPLHQTKATPSFRRGAKRIRLSASVEGSYSLDRVDNAQDLVNSIEKVRITGLATSDLDDPVLQKYLALGSEQTHAEDVNECLSKAFTQQLDSLTSGRAARKPLADVLGEALAYTRYIKVSLKSPSTLSRKL